MLQAFAVIIPLSLGMMFSTVPISAVLAMQLARPRGDLASVFVGGSVIGTVVVAAALTLGFGAVPDHPTATVDPLLGWLQVVLGIVVILAATLIWLVHRRRPRSERRRKARRSPRKSIGDRLAEMPPPAVFAAAVVMCLRPKSLVLTAAAAAAITAASLDPISGAILVVLFSALSVSTTAAPVVVARMMPERFEQIVRTVRSWTQLHAAGITSAFAVSIGAIVVASGLSSI